ncbi:short-chain fatty acid transporter [Stutzerimonas stutzeri]|uniref:Short-chain fatty acid transporter n=1 Tax=Stutzerimonas stutzeri KOS6 TaxID=1218352 RepID=A0A061JJV5_STUST|nr:TIGR00366 family protein [Stutzerimonas stutzeri]EWC39647.1 short-chain fatty acid transporter [Stutzerimonas stutzeri KOS6]
MSNATIAVGAPKPNLLTRFTNVCVRYVERYMPDPYLFAVILTLVVVGLITLFVEGATPGGMVDAWYRGVWGPKSIFTFALQMILILVTGYTLAEAPPLKRGIIWLASHPRTQVEGALLCFAVGAFFCLLNWGLGLVAGALVARQVAKRLPKVHFGYLIASGYMGYLLWTQGLSSSIALANTDTNSPINVIYQLTGMTVPFSQTIFQPYSWVPVVALIVILAIVILRMEPDHALAPDPAVFNDASKDQPKTQPTTFAEKLENLWILNVLFFAAGIYYFVRSDFALNISSLIMLFTVTGALLHWTPIRFIKAFVESAKTAGPLILQYPLYGGIMGLLAYLPMENSQALEEILSSALVTGANEYTLPFLTFLASIVISLFVPSGGGHWGVQGPIAVQSAIAIGQDSAAYMGLMSMAVAFGEAVANMIQPFWLLPVLAIARLNVRQVMGFTVVAFLIGTAVLSIAILIAPFTL